ncbi:putative Cathepsin B [Paratrimastix pyriformis]|uniref:Cathepsin B n=1 Tax=Paratrimastix pyriformis TaxID=342808 RepID=A0ABQ8UT81_9EUKA|nr:putative Cathepsin B [Paratrimastix pyriformis]
MRSIVLLTLLAAAVLARHADDELIHNSEMIAKINAMPGVHWRAAASPRFAGKTWAHGHMLLGTELNANGHLPREEAPANLNLPDSYDTRRVFPNCPFHVLDQQRCGSCWAFAAAEAFADRLCIATNGSFHGDLSPQALVSCDWELNHGCNGGIPRLAWEWMEWEGLPTLQCLPYTSGSGDSGKCKKECANGEPYVTHKVKTFSVKGFTNEAAIMKAIFENGPVETGFEVYADFMTYSSGIYHHVSGSLEGGHAVKIVGWGVENGVKYWIVQNSWGTSWGEGGYFRMLRGKDECGIEKDTCAGLPAL